MKMVALLLEHGANVEVKNAAGSTPLAFAASKKRNLECAILLLEYGARLEVRPSAIC